MPSGPGWGLPAVDEVVEVPAVVELVVVALGADAAA
jgi:hypothetical protein